MNKQFKMRGESMTRVETFVAAAFAFAVTMLVISLGSIPETYQELIYSVKLIPAFAASSAIIFWIWHSHANWCRRYGLEDGMTVVLSGLLIFLVLIYIYPLKIMMQGFFAAISGGFLPVEMKYAAYEELRFMFGFYSLGFVLLSVNFIGFYMLALRKTNQLQLSVFEQYSTETDMWLWGCTAIIGLMSFVGSVILPLQYVMLCGYVYFLMAPVLTTVGIVRNKRLNKLGG